MTWRIKSWKQFEKPAELILAAAGLTALLINLEFNVIEAGLYDFRVSHSAKVSPSESIVMISLDDTTTSALNEIAPLPLDQHVRFLEGLERLNPKAVGYLINMNEVHQAAPELFEQEWGRRFIESASRLRSRGIPFLVGTPYDVNGEILPPYPLSALPHAIAVIHKDGNVFSEDKVTRRALLNLYDRPSFHLQLARELGTASGTELPRGAFHVPEVDGDYFFFKFAGTPKNTYERVSFLDILDGKLAPGAFAGRTVLIGTWIRQNPGDFAKTPTSKNLQGTPKLTVHANILDAISNDLSIILAPPWVNAVVTFALCIFVLTVVLFASPARALVYSLVATAAFLTLGQLAFHGFAGLSSIWIYESQPLVGVFLSFYLAVPYRLFVEYRRRWDFQRRNEILTQVETLKTNFLSLVTHDLKTPVARIQGMAELVLGRQPQLAAQDRETLRGITHSTEELNRFISSILELAKLESDQLTLNLESKDPNQMIERAVENFLPSARSKQVTLEVDLEPIFSIRVDPSLITKVLNNVIDNAIKYSPPSTTVRIQSRDQGGKVEISIKDSGIGLTQEERDQLFTKFYRAKNDTTTRVTGTGLGLYLSRFFVEAHGGSVEVESSPGEGSTFKIVLPEEPDTTLLMSFKPGLKFVKPSKDQKEKSYV